MNVRIITGRRGNLSVFANCFLMQKRNVKFKKNEASGHFN